MTKLAELQRLQKKCIKAEYRLPRLISSTYLYSTSLMPIERLAIVERVYHLHKMIMHRNKYNFTSLCNRDFHSRVTRQSNRLHISLENPALMQSMIDSNRVCDCFSELNSCRVIKVNLKLRVMAESKDYSTISPYRYMN